MSTRARLFITLLAVAPIAAIADHQAATASDTRVANVSLADLDLATQEGMRVARERLQTMAQSVCTELIGKNDPSSRPNFATCVNDTMAGALRQVKAS